MVSLKSDWTVKVACGVVVGLGLTAAAPAYALPQFTFAPSALGGGAAGRANVTADNLQLSDYSTISFTPTSATTSTFTETGTLAVTGYQLGSTVLTGSGLNISYGMYFSFTAAGNQTNYTPTLSSGSFTSLNFTLYGYTLPPSTAPISYTTSNTTPGGVVNPQVLATGGLMNGTVTLAGGIPSAGATVGFNTVLTPFFAAPVPFFNMAFAAFDNTQSEVATSPDGRTITITQGGGSANFATVPEPLSIALLGAGLALTGLVRSRRKDA